MKIHRSFSKGLHGVLHISPRRISSHERYGFVPEKEESIIIFPRYAVQKNHSGNLRYSLEVLIFTGGHIKCGNKDCC